MQQSLLALIGGANGIVELEARCYHHHVATPPFGAVGEYAWLWVSQHYAVAAAEGMGVVSFNECQFHPPAPTSAVG